MAPWLRLGALPPSLLLLIANTACPATCQQLEWPYNLPPDAKYYPEHEHLVRRDVRIQQRLETAPVVGVRKMSPDPGEKFFLDYWSFDQGEVGGQEEDQLLETLQDAASRSNATIFASFDQPVRQHPPPRAHPPPWLRLPGFHLFVKRDFTCPTGYFSCADISQPQACCADGSTCQIVHDTGNGLVGCCAVGGTCGGDLSDCETGYTPCPNQGGGCCLPGYACVEGGCIQTSTVVTNPQTPRTTTVTSYTTVTPSQPDTPAPPPPTTTASATTTLPPVINTVTVTVTRTSVPLTCSAGFRSCPASLGGGCCPTDRECGSANCPAPTTTESLQPPVRPTSADTTTTTVETTTTIVSGCPTGFYACSAVYQGGCCQTGRDCAETSCPPTGSITVVDGSTLTIAAPTGSGVTSAGPLTGNCAAGWATCAQSLGGGCCPSGYACESTTCAATAGGADVGKQAPVGNGGGTAKADLLQGTVAALLAVAALWALQVQ